MKHALTGAMVTILASPVVALIALALLRAAELLPKIGYAAMVAWTLLVTVPIVAALSARRSDESARTAHHFG